MFLHAFLVVLATGFVVGGCVYWKETGRNPLGDLFGSLTSTAHGAPEPRPMQPRGTSSTGPRPRNPSRDQPATQRWSDDELKQLELNPQLRAYLEQDHAWPRGTGASVMKAWKWSDDRNALLYEGDPCEARFIDPNVPATRLSVSVALDVGALRAIEAHMGYPPFLLQGVPFWTHTQGLSEAKADLRRRLRAALAMHGVKYEDVTPIMDYDGVARVSIPVLRPLAEAILRHWQPPGKGPSFDWRIDALTSFVQRAIPYATVAPLGDGLERWELRSPGETLLKGGDCDSKSLLLATLIRSVDPAVPVQLITMIWSDGRPHTMIGVGIEPGSCAATVEHSGTTYTLIESTDRFGIGRPGDTFDAKRIYQWNEIAPLRSGSYGR